VPIANSAIYGLTIDRSGERLVQTVSVASVASMLGARPAVAAVLRIQLGISDSLLF
jgi:hypothetical protein